MCMTGCTGLVKTGDLVVCSSGGTLDSCGYLVRSVPEGTRAARVGKALSYTSELESSKSYMSEGKLVTRA